MSDKDYRQQPKQFAAKTVGLLVFILALVGVAIAISEPEEEDDITILMFDENGDVRTDDLKRIAYFAGFQ